VKKILIADITTDENKKYQFNSVEKKMRGLSYAKALTLEELLKKMKALGLINIQSEQIDSTDNLKASLSISTSVIPCSNKENIHHSKQETEMNNLELKNSEVIDHVCNNLPMSTVFGIKKR